MPSIAERELDDGVIVVRFLQQRLSDPFMLDEQRDELKGLLARAGADRPYVVDFTGVIFIVTNVLNNLLTFNARIARADGKLALCGMAQPVKMVFRRTRLDEVFDIHELLDEAIEQVRR